MIITNVGRPVGRFPMFRWSDGAGGYLLLLQRIDVSDVGNETKAEPFYQPFFKKDDRDGMETWEFRLFDAELILFFSPKGIQHHVSRQNEE